MSAMAGSRAYHARNSAFSSGADSPSSSQSSGAIHLSTLAAPNLSPYERKLRRNHRSLDPFHVPSRTHFTSHHQSLHSISSRPPTPSSSDPESNSKLIRVSKRILKERNTSYLPTPPDTDDEEIDKRASLQASRIEHSPTSSDGNGYPFPLQPSHLPPTQQVPLPKTPSRRCFSAGVARSPKSPFPDRFISNRSTPTSPQTPTETFHVSKAPRDLLPDEKLLRHGSATPDPFGPLKVSRVRNERGHKPRGHATSARLSSRTIGGTIVDEVSPGQVSGQSRAASLGNIWSAGNASRSIIPGPTRGVSNGRGGFISSGSNAPMYESHFLDNLDTDQGVDYMERRLAAAMNIDRTSRVLENTRAYLPPRVVSTGSIEVKRKRLYLEQEAVRKEDPWEQTCSASLLDAPGLRDDYYCTLLSYDRVSRTLAVGLDNRVYLWSEEYGVRYPFVEDDQSETTFITSVSFSSEEGGYSILAVGRNTGHLSLWSLADPEKIRFTSQQPNAIACISFKPVTSLRPSERFGSTVPTEELLVGDEIGQIYYYSIEWMSQRQVDIHGWNGHMKLLAKIEVHTQQICGLAWSSTGEFFATGANDNTCNLFDTKDLLKDPTQTSNPDSAPKGPFQSFFDTLALPHFISRTTTTTTIPSLDVNSPSISRAASNPFSDPFPSFPAFIRHSTTIIPGQDGSLLISEGCQKHKWQHSAAVKAIAICPWQRGLIATGGGSNDRAIHFYHVYSGACLATINVHAQVTSLIWSTTRREIAATFGYPQPDHPYRIAVFSWPGCREVVKVPWGSELRALFAVAFPGSCVSGEGGRRGGAGRGMGRGGGLRRESRALGERWYDRTREEGCIVVASSDESVKFHEVWAGASRVPAEAGVGVLGGSPILERLEGGGGGGNDGEWLIR
ncbi:uncharacterized protein KY384_004542 [Bacidia gigantensis]|uniref:uncharacterized protein n=1 Tax=Bacidia gigantensis TaxID=2732470 RepID=UPI001D04BAE3|nr:uncharacterized protein KY384_004542 [Bacidia gigantensis]KAG8531184.1 hypothetical protein KY384_004542 [Bacidia gigantensis]